MSAMKKSEFVRRVHDRGALVEPVAWRIHPKAAPAICDDARDATSAVLLEMEQPERYGSQHNAGRRAQAADQQRLQKSAKDQFLAERPQSDAQHAITSTSARVSISRVIGLSPVGVWIRLLVTATRTAVIMPHSITHITGMRIGVQPSERQNGRSYSTEHSFAASRTRGRTIPTSRRQCLPLPI